MPQRHQQPTPSVDVTAITAMDSTAMMARPADGTVPLAVVTTLTTVSPSAECTIYNGKDITHTGWNPQSVAPNRSRGSSVQRTPAAVLYISVCITAFWDESQHVMTFHLRSALHHKLPSQPKHSLSCPSCSHLHPLVALGDASS